MTHQSFGVFHFSRNVGKFCEEPMTANKTTKPSGYMLTYSNHIHDGTIFVLMCKAHRRVLLKVHKKGNCYYLPFYPLKLCNSWKTQIRHCLYLLMKAAGFHNEDALQMSKTRTHLHQLNQLQHPHYAEYLHQLVVFVELESCYAKCDFNNPSSHQKWFQVDHVTVNHSQIWGPEPCIYLIQQATQVLSKCRELSIEREFKGSQPVKRWAIAQSIKYSDHDLAGLYNDFLQHCYPSQFMNQVMFENYLAKTEIKLDVNSEVPGDKKQRLYAAFCIDMPYIRFKDLVLGMVALDRHCNHGDMGGELRTRCIFRYYSKIGSTFINFNELVAMNRDIAICKKEELNPVDAAESAFAKLGLSKDSKDGISIENFIQLVGKLEIRGTASIFRTIHSPLEQIRSRKQAYKRLWACKVEWTQMLEQKTLPKVLHYYCSRCADPKYTLGLHSITCNVANGEIVPFQEQPSEHMAKIPKLVREQSQEATNIKNKFSYLRAILRRFSYERHGYPMVFTQSNLPDWTKKTDRMNLVEQIVAVCKESKNTFLNGPRVIHTSSPVFVFGDIHGNLRDLMIYDHLFWRMAPWGYLATNLFLGDYVDRGNDSVECVLYLLCMRALHPDKFLILRGNHEIRQVQRAFTTHRECLEKFGPFGEKVWDSLNSVFDCLPFCGIVDEQIFAAHGGIPASSPYIETLNAVSVPLEDPKDCPKSKTAWEVLWNDPVAYTDYKDFSDALEKKSSTLFPMNPPGFLFNTKRGTAFFYNCEAVDRFMKVNGLKYLLRAHEVIPTGFQFLMDGRMMTLFSSSHYCGSSNQSAVAFIDEHCKIRVIQIETDQSFCA